MPATHTGSSIRSVSDPPYIDSIARRIIAGDREITAGFAWGEVLCSRIHDVVVGRVMPHGVIGTVAAMAMLADRLNEEATSGVVADGPLFHWRADMAGFGVYASANVDLVGDAHASIHHLFDAAQEAAHAAVRWSREREGPAHIGVWDRRRDQALAWVRHQIRLISARRLPVLPKNGMRDAQMLTVCLAPSLDPTEKTLLLRALAGGVLDDEVQRRLIVMLEIDRECGCQMLRHGAPIDIRKSWRQMPVQVDPILAAAADATCINERPIPIARTWITDPQDDEQDDPIVSCGGADDLRADLAKHVHGQDEAIDALAVALYRHREHCHRGAVLVRGPTGCGKSLMISHGAALLGVPVIHASAASLVPEGVYGPSLSSIFLDLFERAGRDIDKAQCGIVLLDEIDKLTMDSSTKYGAIVLSQLLRIIDGCSYQLISDKRDFTLHAIDTSRMLFVLAGAWMNLEDESDNRVGFAIDRASDGRFANTATEQNLAIAPELLGRIASTIRLRPLSAHVLREILLDPVTSPLSTMRKHLEQRGSTLSVDPAAIDAWVSQALVDGLGARGLQQQIDDALRPLWRRCGQERGMRYEFGAEGLSVTEGPQPRTDT